MPEDLEKDLEEWQALLRLLAPYWRPAWGTK
jgi:hypothetical protein